MHKNDAFENDLGTTNREIVVSSPKRPLKDLLREIERFSSWNDPPPRLKEVLEECLAFYPNEKNKIEHRKQRGEQANILLKPFYKIGTKFGLMSQEAIDALNSLKIEHHRPDLIQRARNQISKGAAAKKRNEDFRHAGVEVASIQKVKGRSNEMQTTQAPSKQLGTQIFPKTSEASLHPNDIRGLKHSDHWSLLIDEAGSIFDEGAAEVALDNSKLGRLVGLLLPKDHGLYPLSNGWHATDKSVSEISRVIQNILDAPVGVIGINVLQLPEMATERWALGVLRLIELVLRLLPLEDSNPTTLTVSVENRGEYTRGMEWLAVAQDAILQLAHSFPKRAALITCRIRVIGKRDSALNGYVDSLAFIWAGASAFSRECLKQSGFEGTCFLPGDAEAVGRAWDWLERGVSLRGIDWATLLAQPEVGNPASLTMTILDRLGQASVQDTKLWRRYLEHTQEYLESKAIDLKTLGNQVGWLERWAPPGEFLPPPVRLLWLTTRLARTNHLGHTEQQWVGEMKILGDQLLEENANLVCRAELNLAVNATNRFQFETAAKVLARWQMLPIAVPGLRYWAQVQSSLGQHAAFEGKHKVAIEYFNKALDAFSRLSSERQASRESQQTLTYLAIVMMDCEGLDYNVRLEAIERTIGPLTMAISNLSNQAEQQDKYKHHLLIRWLVYRGSADLCSQYLAERDNWQVGEGFPWPLIQLYRGFLLRGSDQKSACALLKSAYELARAAGQGPTMRMIGACCRVIAKVWGEPWSETEMNEELKYLHTELPGAKSNIDLLNNYANSPNGDPKFHLGAILPFNFH